MTEIWAHARAEAHPVPNLLASFEAAVREAPDGIELDVHRTRDGRLVCTHDHEVHDQDGRAFSIGDLDYDELAAFSDPRKSGPDGRAPLLDEVYDLVGPTTIKLNIEAKNLLRRYPDMARTLIRSVRGSGMGERVVISTFHHRLLQEIAAEAPDVRRAALYADGLVEPWRYFRHLGVDEVHPHFSSLLDEGVAAGFATAGIRLRVWTVNDPALWRRFADDGLEAIITDLPVSARTALTDDERGAPDAGH